MSDSQPYAEIAIVIQDADGNTTAINVPMTTDIRWEYGSVPVNEDMRWKGLTPGLLDLKLSFRAIFDEAKDHHYTITKKDKHGNPIQW